MTSLLAGEADREPSIVLADRPGDYRVRVSGRGRRRQRASSPDRTAPIEWYLIEAWPATIAPAAAIRLTSDVARTRHHDPARPAVPDAEAGLAAAARIGKDIDAARSLSGDGGQIVVESTLPGPRTRWFRSFAYMINWSHWWAGSESWSLIALDRRDYEIGTPRFGQPIDRGHPDRLAGEGAIRVALLEVDQPALVVRSWNWLRPPERDDEPFASRAPVLHVDSVLTVELTETTDSAGQPATHVHLAHAGLPAEWVDDMRAWWAFQLDIARHTGLRR